MMFYSRFVSVWRVMCVCAVGVSGVCFASEHVETQGSVQIVTNDQGTFLQGEDGALRPADQKDMDHVRATGDMPPSTPEEAKMNKETDQLIDQVVTEDDKNHPKGEEERKPWD